ncbi:hypothetical protein CSAL01_01668 [Colletotrichum salicis]|uniref:Uncharacterized protein n=1 Tax=Colletotrichum salicis TaxID=1209931 RepID=A0A135S134_9PEZI|nr:hypothetical protein CSAL01_01668 [Colletotrichum salicis]
MNHQVFLTSGQRYSVPISVGRTREMTCRVPLIPPSSSFTISFGHEGTAPVHRPQILYIQDPGSAPVLFLVNHLHESSGELGISVMVPSLFDPYFPFRFRSCRSFKAMAAGGAAVGFGVDFGVDFGVELGVVFRLFLLEAGDTVNRDFAPASVRRAWAGGDVLL